MNSVSVIMPAYNAEATLNESVQSVLAQTWPHWELILVVDSKSGDRTRQIAMDLARMDDRIRLVADLPSGGCVYNRNEGLALATGDFIAFLDSDDRWHADKLQRQVEFMNATGCDLSYTGYAQMDWQGNPLPAEVRPPPRLSYNDLLNDNLLGCLTSMIRRSRFPDVRFVDHLHEDLILWLALLKQTDAQGLPDVLAVYRQARHSRSGNKFRAAAARWRILRTYEHLPLSKAIPCFARYAFGALRKRSKSSQTVSA